MARAKGVKPLRLRPDAAWATKVISLAVEVRSYTMNISCKYNGKTYQYYRTRDSSRLLTTRATRENVSLVN